MTKVSELSSFDVMAHLDSPQAIADYLTIALEDEDPDFVLTALNDIARAKEQLELKKVVAFEPYLTIKKLELKKRARLEKIRTEWWAELESYVPKKRIKYKLHLVELT